MFGSICASFLFMYIAHVTVRFLHICGLGFPSVLELRTNRYVCACVASGYASFSCARLRWAVPQNLHSTLDSFMRVESFGARLQRRSRRLNLDFTHHTLPFGPRTASCSRQTGSLRSCFGHCERRQLRSHAHVPLPFAASPQNNVLGQSRLPIRDEGASCKASKRSIEFEVAARSVDCR